MIIRAETSRDIPFIRATTEAAFAPVVRSSGTEGSIIDALRRNGALTVSLVADHAGAILGHVAFSPVLIDGRGLGWFGLGPVSVLPEYQRVGIGTALIKEGLARLKIQNANGCVVLGDPKFYQRFGFSSRHGLHYEHMVAEHFQSLTLCGNPASGAVTYDEGFWEA
jgi:putative acetyltransferase